MNLRQAMSRFQNTIYARAVRHGLTLAIPFLIMGSFALLLTNFPLGVYQDFIRTWMNSAASAILETLYQISLGSLALVLTVTISISYGHLTETDQLFCTLLSRSAPTWLSAEGLKTRVTTFLMQNGYSQQW